MLAVQWDEGEVVEREEVHQQEVAGAEGRCARVLFEKVFLKAERVRASPLVEAEPGVQVGLEEVLEVQNEEEAERCEEEQGVLWAVRAVPLEGQAAQEVPEEELGHCESASISHSEGCSHFLTGGAGGAGGPRLGGPGGGGGAGGAALGLPGGGGGGGAGGAALGLPGGGGAGGAALGRGGALAGLGTFGAEERVDAPACR